MIIEGLTYGEAKREKHSTTACSFIQLQFNQLLVISNLIKGTESKEWLRASEDEANYILKHGNGNDRV